MAKKNKNTEEGIVTVYKDEDEKAFRESPDSIVVEESEEE